MTNITRVPEGIPAGGQFSAHSRTEATIELGNPKRFAGTMLPEPLFVEPNYDVYGAEYDQQNAKPVSVSVTALTLAQRDAVYIARTLLDERRSRPAVSAGHRYETFQESDGKIAVYIKSRQDGATFDEDSMRLVLDTNGLVHQMHHGVGDEYGIIWEDLAR